MVFTNVRNPRSAYPTANEACARTLVRCGATIGANATIVCGGMLGAWSPIGAGAVVTKDVSAHALMTGVPARRTGWACECGQVLPTSLHCEACSRTYIDSPAGELAEA